MLPEVLEPVAVSNAASSDGFGSFLGELIAAYVYIMAGFGLDMLANWWLLGFVLGTLVAVGKSCGPFIDTMRDASVVLTSRLER